MGLKSCNNSSLNLSFNLPNNSWECKNLENGYTTTAANAKFTIQISSLGRGAFCDPPNPDPNSPRYDPTNACTVTSFYAKNNLDLKTYKLSGQTKEIFGQVTNGPSVSITYKNMETEDLSAIDKTELLKLLDSIKFTN